MFARDSYMVRFTLVTFFALILFYAVYEAWGLLSGPSIEIPSHSITSHEQYVHITGRALRMTELRLNGATVSVTEDGMFNEPYLLAVGSNHVLLEAYDARGRMDRAKITITYVPDSAPTSSARTPTEPGIPPHQSF